MVVVVHTFGEGVKAHVIEAWLPYYIPFAELKALLVDERGSAKQHRWALLGRMLPSRFALSSPLSVAPQRSHRRGGNSADDTFLTTPSAVASSTSAVAAVVPAPSPGSTHASSSPNRPKPQRTFHPPTVHLPHLSHTPKLADFTTHSTGAGDVVTMADLGRSDSLERIGGLDCFEGDLTALSPSASAEGQEIAQQLVFLEAFREHAHRCDGFFAAESDRVLQEYNEALRQLKAAEHALSSISKHKQSLANFQATKVWTDIKAVYKSIHKEIKDLRSFGRTNFDLCIRLVKAYRRAVGRSSRVASGMWQHLRKREFADDERLHALSLELEKQYADAFTFGFVPFAHKELYTPLKGEWKVFRVGMRFGTCLLLLIWLLWDSFFDATGGVDLFKHPVVHIYAAIGGGLLLLWTWALNLCVWERAGVDFAAIFGFTSALSTVEEVFSTASLATTLYLFNLLMYYKLLRGVGGPLQAVPAHLFPVLLITYCLYKLFFPWSQRSEMWTIIGQIVLAPFGEVGFKELFFADTMTSFNKVSYEAVLGGCYLFRGGFASDHHQENGVGGMGGGSAATSTYYGQCGPTSVAQKYIAPLVIAYPLWLRLLQCLKRYYVTKRRIPPLPNACKYGISMSVVLFAVFNPEYSRGVLNNKDKQGAAFDAYEFFWLLSQIGTTLGTWWWDVVMDWGLFQNRKGLRSHLLFRRHVWIYYSAIVLDLVLRFLWTVSLLPQATSGFVYDFQVRVRFFTPPLELLRRSIWAWLKLEREQSLRDIEDGVLEDMLRQKRASKNKAERTRRLEEIANEVTRLCKAVEFAQARGAAQQTSRGGKLLDMSTSSSSRTLGRSNNSTMNPGVRDWDDDHVGDNNTVEEDEDEDMAGYEDVLEAQKKLQKDLVSHRSVVVEVCVVLFTFVGLAVWAAGDH